jgi:branched-chain amino acid transport system substrate-binding protein
VRRHLIGVIVAVVAACAPAAVPVGAQQSPVKIGLIVSLTGRVAQNGRDMVNGLTLALDQINRRAAGREIQVAVEDDGGTPAGALTKTWKLVELDRVDVLMGPISANSGYALRDYIDGQKIPAFYPVVAADDLTQRNGTPWIVRTGWTSSQPNHPLGEYAAKVLHFRRVVAIANDFAFGWESVGGFQRTFELNGGRVIEHVWPPLSAPDYSPYLGRIPRDVDAVYAEFSGGDALRFLQQYKEFGLAGRIPLLGGGTVTDESILFQEGELAKGVVTSLHYSAALDTPANREFVRRYIRAYNRVPSFYSETMYTTAQFLQKGLEAVRPPDREPERVRGGGAESRPAGRAAGSAQARCLGEPRRERVHPPGGHRQGAAAEYGGLHLPERLAVLDVQSRGISEAAGVLAGQPSGAPLEHGFLVG